MDPITLASITSAVVALALDAAKDAAPGIVKDTWEQAKKWMGWEHAPANEQLSAAVEARLKDDDVLVQKLEELLKERGRGPAGSLVGTIKAEKVVVAKRIDTLHM
ncbi:MAG: hypothetical protein ACOYN0_14880 [Phycisphaerales bacterium]